MGEVWSCHGDHTVYCEDVGLTYGYLKGEGETLEACEMASNGAAFPFPFPHHFWLTVRRRWEGLANISAMLFHGKYCELQFKCQHSSNFSIENAASMENCP